MPLSHPRIITLENKEQKTIDEKVPHRITYGTFQYNRMYLPQEFWTIPTRTERQQTMGVRYHPPQAKVPPS